MTKEENEREYRVLNQSLSMHSVLAQEFARKERRLNISLLLVSAVLCAFTFAEDSVLSLLGVSPAVAKLLIGVCSAFVFGLSIVELKVNWSGVSEAHADAARRLAGLKMEYRKVYASLATDKTSQWAMLSQKYAEISGALRPIDERQFTRLKAHHATKVALSKMVDQHPGVPVFVLAGKLRVSACWRLMSSKTTPLMANRSPTEQLAHAYLDAKEAVLAAGFANEVDWQDEIRVSDLTETRFLSEYAWVVFSSGFRESILRAKFPALRLAFGEFSSAQEIWRNRAKCRRQALEAFGHRGKVTAVLECSRLITAAGFESVRSGLNSRGVSALRDLPYMGPITSLHLAKNIGIDVVKPDRHLIRIAEHSGYDTPLEMCSAIRELVGDALSVIDVVIWRYATIEPAAPKNFSGRFCAGT